MTEGHYTMTNSKTLLHSRMIEAAQRYAAANKSDPFALNVALSHISNGISNIRSDNGKPAYYDADVHSEMRSLPEGVVFATGKTEYSATVYRNVVRP